MSTVPESKEVTTVESRPSYLSTATPYKSTMTDYAQPARLKIIQALTSAPFKPPFKDGDIIVNPYLTKVGDLETPFSFTPLVFFANFACLNPARMRQQLTMIRKYSDSNDIMLSFDPNGEIAKNARAFKSFPCPENPKEECKYVTILNFVIVIHHDDVPPVPIAISFMKGEYRTGQTLIGLHQTRKDAPLCACRFRATSAIHSSKGNNWYGLNISNDYEPWVPEAQFKIFEEQSGKLQKLIDERAIQIDFDDTDVEGNDPADEKKF